MPSFEDLMAIPPCGLIIPAIINNRQGSILVTRPFWYHRRMTKTGLTTTLLIGVFASTLLCWGSPCLGQTESGSQSKSAAQNNSNQQAPKQEATTGQESDATPAKEYEFERFAGIEYKSGADYQLKLDVYVPEGQGPYPAILAVHGGSWRAGSKFHWLRHGRKMARAGYVVVAINYRHAPTHKFPAQIHDCKAAVRWMRINADEYKIDPEEIGAAGYSAGGHLVGLLGTTDADDAMEGDVPEDERGISTRIKAVAAGGAPCEFSWIDEDSSALAYWLGNSRRDDPEIYKAASPTTYITEDDPPFHFFHGTSDWLVPESSPKLMHEKLQEQSIESTYKTYEDFGHFGLFSHLEAFDPVIEFFNEHLERKHSP